MPRPFHHKICGVVTPNTRIDAYAMARSHTLINLVHGSSCMSRGTPERKSILF